MSDTHPTSSDAPRRGSGVAMALAAGLLLTACSQAPEPARGDAAVAAAPSDETASVRAQDAAVAEPAASTPEEGARPGGSETIGGDGSPIQLDPLTAQDLAEAGLAGELACAFTVGDAPPLLYGIGLVDSDEPAQGVVKVAGYVEPVRTPGGFDAMLHDPVFSGRGKTIRIAITGTGGPGEESPAVPATLLYQRADGASRTIEGHWQCGP